MPKFASLNLNNVPMNESGNPSLGQLMAAIVDIRRKMVTTEMLTSSINDLKYESASSSLVLAASVDAPRPPPLPFASDASTSNQSSAAIQSNITPLSILSPSAPSFNAVVAASSDTAVEPTADTRSEVRRGGRRGGGGGRGGQRGRGGGHHSRTQFPRGSSNVSQSRVIIGKKVNEGLLSVKGADLTVNKYIGRLHNDVTIEGMREFLDSQKVTVVELEQLETKHDRFKSFRLRVKRDDLKIIEEHDFWPEGVLCGPFFRPKASDERRQTNGETTASGSIINGGT